VAALLSLAGALGAGDGGNAAAPPLSPLAARLETSLPGPWPLFPATNWWNTEIGSAPLDSNSVGYIGFINQGGVKHLHPDLGGTLGDGVHIYGMPYIVVDGNQPKKTVNFHYFDQSDGVNHPGNNPYPFYPIPDEAITQAHWIEGGDPGNVDRRSTEDRHMLIVDRDNRYLYELYNVYYDAGLQQWQGGSGAFFDLNLDGRRPEGWTSADAAGLAILPGLLRYEEVYGMGEIRHALRFTVRSTGGYVYPASHVAGSASGALPMGARLRLRASKDISGFAPEVQKIFRAMKTYGLIVADNGTDMYIGGTWDDRWDNDVLNPAFDALTASDFEVVQLGWSPPLASALDVDAHPGTSANGNGVLEAGESVSVEPSWRGSATQPPAALAGVASGASGPAGATYVLDDASAAYGSPAADAPVSCADATGNCYAVSVSNPPTRPAAHWDASFHETVNGSAARTWTLHVGKSFTDAPESHPFYAAIETLFHSGVTVGCGPSLACPDDGVTRAEMAIFLLKAKLGPGYAPPAGSGTVFADVPPGSFALSWIEELFASGTSAGCGPGIFCPNDTVTRAQMAVFLLKARRGNAYLPPPASGIFDDVPAGDSYAPWIEELYRSGITAGCGGNGYCPNDPNTRGQMAVFLDLTFGLKLYAP
jgi:S-layer homology domain